jgi:hypothetical protein
MYALPRASTPNGVDNGRCRRKKEKKKETKSRTLSLLYSRVSPAKLLES